VIAAPPLRSWNGLRDGVTGLHNGKDCQSFVLRESMSTMNISLTPQLEKLVQDRVKSGRYTSASEVVREAFAICSTRVIAQ